MTIEIAIVVAFIGAVATLGAAFISLIGKLGAAYLPYAVGPASHAAGTDTQDTIDSTMTETQAARVRAASPSPTIQSYRSRLLEAFRESWPFIAVNVSLSILRTYLVEKPGLPTRLDVLGLAVSCTLLAVSFAAQLVIPNLIWLRGRNRGN
jgi:hypothetical protein